MQTFISNFLLAPLSTPFILFLPEIYIFLGILFIAVSEITYHKEKTRLVFPIAILSLCSAIVHTFWSFGVLDTLPEVYRNVTYTRYTAFFKIILLFIGLLQLFYGVLIRSKDQKEQSEYYVFLFMLIIGALGMIQADGLILFVVSMILFFISNWLLTLTTKRTKLSEFSSRTMFFSGIFSIVLFFVFILFFFKIFGSFNLSDIKNFKDAGIVVHQNSLLFLYVLFLFSIASILLSFPTQLFFPDVLKGASSYSLPLISLVGPFVAFSFCFRVSETLFLPLFLQQEIDQSILFSGWRSVSITLSFLGMFYSAFMAFVSQHLRKLIAYILLFQFSFFYMSFSVLNEKVFSASVIGLLSILLSSYGLFFFIEKFQKKGYLNHSLSYFKGILLSEKKDVLFFIFFLLGLMGFPLFPGFVSKFIIISELIGMKNYWIVFSALLFEIVIIASLGRFIFILTQENENKKFVENKNTRLQGRNEAIFLFLLIVPSVVTFFYLSKVLNWLSESFRFLLWS